MGTDLVPTNNWKGVCLKKCANRKKKKLCYECFRLQNGEYSNYKEVK